MDVNKVAIKDNVEKIVCKDIKEEASLIKKANEVNNFIEINVVYLKGFLILAKGLGNVGQTKLKDSNIKVNIICLNDKG